VIAGDIGFARTTGVMGRLIRFGELLKGKPGSEWNHQFIVDRQIDGEWYIIQATMRGVTDTAKLADVAPGGKYVTMSPPTECDRAKILEFNRAQVGDKYSFLTILSIAFDILTWNFVPAFMNSYRQSWVCSGLVNESMRYAGWLHEYINVYLVTPQQGFNALKPQ
jgi:hypothetical protein